MDEFARYRAEMNERLLGSHHLGIKRFFALDTQAYEEGALDKRTKDLMGLTVRQSWQALPHWVAAAPQPLPERLQCS